MHKYLRLLFYWPFYYYEIIFFIPRNIFFSEIHFVFNMVSSVFFWILLAWYIFPHFWSSFISFILKRVFYRQDIVESYFFLSSLKISCLFIGVYRSFTINVQILIFVVINKDLRIIIITSYNVVLLLNFNFP